MHDGDQSAVQRGEPAVPELPQGAAELLLTRTELLAVTVEVPPAGAVARVQETAVRRPVGLGDGLLRAAGHPAGLPERALVDLGDDQLRAVPGHARVVPGEPGRARAVGRQPRPGDEPVADVGEFTHRVPVLHGRAVQRHGGQDPADIGGPVPGELLQDAPHLTELGSQLRLCPAQSAADRGDRRERDRLAAGPEAVQPLVGEVHEHDERFARHHLAGPGVAAVLDDPAAHVPRRGQHRLLPAVGAPAHQGAAAALGGPGLGPPHLVPDEAQPFGVPVVRGRERRVDGRGPGTVCRRLHVLPHLLRSFAGSGRVPARRSAVPRRGHARRPRGRGPGSRSPPGASGARTRTR